MKLVKELYNAGILGHQSTRSTGYEFVNDRGPNLEFTNPIASSQRLEKSTKVSPKGWRTLTDVLRLR